MRPKTLSFRFIVASCLVATSSLFCTPVDVIVIGDNPIPPPTSEQVLSTTLTQSIQVALNSGESVTWGGGGQVDVLGNPIDFYWAAYGGRLESLAPRHGKVRFTAPSVSEKTQVLVFVQATSQSGNVTFGTITVTVSPALSQTAVVSGQMSVAYSGASGVFSINYKLGAMASRAWILASPDGSIWNQVVHTIDPVTSANRTGNQTVTIAGSEFRTLTYFRLRVQDGTSLPQDGVPVSVVYTPVPSIPKSTELPYAPSLVFNGFEVSVPQVQLFWRRVNDRLDQDNVVRYEVERATNPDFTGATLVDAGNTAPGLNMYENVFYTATDLADNTTYYFRVRGVNHVGTGTWSNVGSIRVNIQDRPVFDVSNPVFPSHNAVGVTKLPALEINCTDPDGDSIYTAFEISEDPAMSPGTIRYFGHGGQQAYLNMTRLDPDEWGSNPLKPNTRYYWRAVVQEEGRWLDYYGGTWPATQIYSFTTENVGGNFTLSDVVKLSGDLRPHERITYQVTVTNNGNERSEPNLINVWYVKNGIESPFRYNDWGNVPALDPGQSTTTNVVAYFQTEGFTNPNNGVTYDDVLVTGPSILRFKSSPYVIATPQASVDHSINYANQGGPTVNWQIRSDTSNKPVAALGGKFIIATSIVDDIRTTRVLLEYRPNGAAPWTVLDDYTGNTTYYANFPSMAHSGATVATNQGSVEWTFGPSFPQTSTLQIRMTAFDDVGATTVVTSELMTVLDGTLVVNAGATEFPAYRVGDQLRFPLSVTKAPGMRITNVTINYWYGPSSAERVFDVRWTPGNFAFSNGSGPLPVDPAWMGLDGIQVPPVVTVTIPPNLAYAVPGGYFKVRVQAEVPGLHYASVEDTTNGTIAVSAAELPAPFHNYITVPTPPEPDWPAGAWARSLSITPTAVDWQGDTAVHALYRLDSFYLLDDVLGGSVPHYGVDYYYASYDRVTKQVTQTPLSSAYAFDDLKVLGSTAYLLLHNGAAVSMAAMSGTTMGTPQSVLTLPAPVTETNQPEFARIGSELYVASSTRSSGGSGTWRSRIQRVLPSILPFVEHSAYYGLHVDYGTHLNTETGVYALSGTKSVTSTVNTWPYIGIVRFESSTPSVVGARAGFDSGMQIVDLYAGNGAAIRWHARIQDPAVSAFSDVAFAVGMGIEGGFPGENYNRVVIRRNSTTGIEERIFFRDYYESGRNSAVSSGKWVAIATRDRLAIGYMGGDLTAPAVQITTADISFVTGQPKDIAWTMSDNLAQLASLKVLKIAGGVTTEIGSYTGGALPASLSYTFADTVPSLILRVEAYDQSGNRGVAEKVLTRSSTFTLPSFAANAYSIPMGTAALLTWTATPSDSFRVYNILIRPQGDTEWSKAGSATGNTYALDTSLLTGSFEVRLESGGVFRDLPQVITITGNRFAFDYSGFGPPGASAYYSDASRVIRLSWGTNQLVSPSISYSLLGRWNGTGNYGVLGVTTDKTLDVNVGSNTQLEWKVIALWEGLEFVSTVKTTALVALATPGAPTTTLGARDTALPWVDLSWTAVPGADLYAVFRRDIRTDSVEEVVRPVLQLSG